MNVARTFAIAGCLALAIAGCRSAIAPAAPEAGVDRALESEWKRYSALTHFKAIVVAADANGAYVFGTSHGKASWQDALAEAYALCEKRRSERKVSQPCRPYAIGDLPTGRAETP